MADVDSGPFRSFYGPVREFQGAHVITSMWIVMCKAGPWHQLQSEQEEVASPSCHLPLTALIEYQTTQLKDKQNVGHHNRESMGEIMVHQDREKMEDDAVHHNRESIGKNAVHHDRESLGAGV